LVTAHLSGSYLLYTGPGNCQGNGPKRNFGLAKRNLGLAKRNFGLAKRNFGLAKRNFGLAKRNFGLAKRNFGFPKRYSVEKCANVGRPA
jgi:hypothetical protein